MNTKGHNLLLADDDEDDCDFFKEALEELLIPFYLKTVHNGVQLMNSLINLPADNLPDILFLDLNMPLKNGTECLSEIKMNPKLQQLPVIVFSTSLDTNIVNTMYDGGAVYYIRKPGDYTQLKKVLKNALALIPINNLEQPKREHFVLEP